MIAVNCAIYIDGVVTKAVGSAHDPLTGGKILQNDSRFFLVQCNLLITAPNGYLRCSFTDTFT